MKLTIKNSKKKKLLSEVLSKEQQALVKKLSDQGIEILPGGKKPKGHKITRAIIDKVPEEYQDDVEAIWHTADTTPGASGLAAKAPGPVKPDVLTDFLSLGPEHKFPVTKVGNFIKGFYDKEKLTDSTLFPATQGDLGAQANQAIHALDVGRAKQLQQNIGKTLKSTMEWVAADTTEKQLDLELKDKNWEGLSGSGGMPGNGDAGQKGYELKDTRIVGIMCALYYMWVLCSVLNQKDKFLKGKTTDLIAGYNAQWDKIKGLPNADQCDKFRAAGPSAEGGGEAAPEPEGDESNKDVPLSFFKRQKDQPSLKSDSGAWELPLVAYLQKKLKMSAKAAQRIAKGLAGTLKSKGVLIAESQVRGMLLYALVEQLLLDEPAPAILSEVASTSDNAKKVIRGLLQKGMADEAPEEKKAQANKAALSLHQIAKTGNAHKFNSWLKKYSPKFAMNLSTGLYDEMSSSEIGDLMQWTLKDPVVRKYTQKYAGGRAEKKADKAAAKKGMEAMGGKYGLVGKVLYKYAARGGRKDPEFMKAFGGEAQDQNRIIRSIEKMIRRQFKRRGFDQTEIEKVMLESLSKQRMADIKTLVTEFYPYAKKELAFDQPVKVVFKHDGENAADPMGKTGYYDPSSHTMGLYVTDRHPKDVLRSFAHELTHHAQNCRGDLDNFAGEEGYAQTGAGAALESEAYLGSQLVRNWEDTRNTSQLNENTIKGDSEMTEESLRKAIASLVKEALEEEGKKEEGEQGEDPWELEGGVKIPKPDWKEKKEEGGLNEIQPQPDQDPKRDDDEPEEEEEPLEEWHNNQLYEALKKRWAN